MAPATQVDDAPSESGPLESMWRKLSSFSCNFGGLDFESISTMLFHETLFSMLLGLWALIGEYVLIRLSVYDLNPGSPWLLLVPIATWVTIVSIKLVERFFLQNGDSPAQRTQRIVLNIGLILVQLAVGSIGSQDREEVLKVIYADDRWPLNDGWQIPITLTRMFVGSCATMTLYRMFYDMTIKACLFEGFVMVNDDDKEEEEEEMKRQNAQSTPRHLTYDNNDNIPRSSTSFPNTDVNQHFAAPANDRIDTRYRN
ncbi:unnamed protein product [Orchesella dallaii]|uniref:Transmembrane protein n=1 Tax=Orchesella dallaii TaxID=48710 RepID=A0ABP1QKX9_9HEXA